MLSLFDNKKIVCGVDEAGRGSLAGPVTAAAVILPKNYKSYYKLIINGITVNEVFSK